MMLNALTGELTFTSLKPLDLSSCTKQDIKAYFENSYNLNESIFTGLRDESVFYTCPDRLRLPLVFYFAHTASVYVNKLMLAGLINERVNLEFETMFETGVDEMSWDDTENYRMGGSFKWPPIKDVVEYRRNVRNLILNLIEDTPLELPITMESPWWALMMGMEHERIHLETSSVLIRQLPIDLVSRPPGWVYGPVKHIEGVTKNELVKVEETEVTMGKPEDFPSYGWDNEYGKVTCKVPAFEATQFLVTNREFLEFVRAGGYNKRELWTPEGWEWRQYRQAKHPTFWVCSNGCKSGCGAALSGRSHCTLSEDDVIARSGNQPQGPVYKMRLMFDVMDMAWDWPVEVNYHEAKAYCCWRGPDFRLPIEAELHAMRGKQRPVSEGATSDIIFQDNIQANINMKYGSSTPVNLFPPTDAGFYDVFGNVWEWGEDHFNGLDGFQTHWLYDDFSTPTFDGRHNVILGGSWISTGDEASRFARYAFRRHFYQHCGFRMARSPKNTGSKLQLPVRLIKDEVFVLGVGVQDTPVYLDDKAFDLQPGYTTNTHYSFDTAEALEGILELEWGFRDSFPAVLAGLCATYLSVFKIPNAAACHLGGGSGRGPFELSKYFDHVLGVEFGGRLVAACLTLQQNRRLSSIRPNGQKQEIALDSDIDTDKVVFKQMTWVPNEIPAHNLVLLSHLERVQNPKAWLARLWEITLPDGIAVVATSNGTWGTEELTPHLDRALRCISIQEVPYQSPKGTATAMVTVWKHK